MVTNRTANARILFGPHDTWNFRIAASLAGSRFEPIVAPFDAVEFAAFNLVVPLQVDQARLLQVRRRDNHPRWIVPSREAIEICDDKLALAKLLVSEGFGRYIPDIYEEDCRYPHIRKPRRGQFGRGIQIVTGPEDGHDNPPSSDHFRQQLIPGRFEFVCHILRADGQVRFVRAYRYEMGGDNLVRGMAATPLSSVRHDPSTELPLFARMLDALAFEGTCCVNYKLGEAVPIVFEINPRFGGSLVRDVTDYLEAHLALLAPRDG